MVVVCLSLWGSVTLSQDNVIPPIPATEKATPTPPPTPSSEASLLPGIAAISTVAAVFASINPTVAAVTIGGGLGALSRYTVSRGVNGWVEGSFHGTMVVNIIGSFAFGTISGWVARSSSGIADTAWLDLMTTGFLGGFTTFSTFAHDTVQIAHEEGILFSALYTGFSVAVAVMAILAGEFVGTTLLP
ncbi:fluoride exporter [Gammaproteobacteria bacterium]